jgi:hypothetical protein
MGEHRAELLAIFPHAIVTQDAPRFLQEGRVV